MGRAKINDLLDLVGKYGGEHAIAFQQARLNFLCRWFRVQGDSGTRNH